jgi:hypothetical protein
MQDTLPDTAIFLNDVVSLDLTTLIETRLIIQANSGGGKTCLLDCDCLWNFRMDCRIVAAAILYRIDRPLFSSLSSFTCGDSA